MTTSGDGDSDPDDMDSDRESRVSYSTDSDVPPPDDDDDDHDDGNGPGDEDHSPRGGGPDRRYDDSPDGRGPAGPGPDEPGPSPPHQDDGMFDDMPDLEDETADSQVDNEEDDVHPEPNEEDDPLYYFEATREQRERLPDLLDDDELSTASSGARARHNYLVDLARAARGADDRFRHQAEEELARAMASADRRDRQEANQRPMGAEPGVPEVPSDISWEDEPQFTPRNQSVRREGQEHETSHHSDGGSLADLPTAAPRKRTRMWVERSSSDHPVDDDDVTGDIPEPRQAEKPKQAPKTGAEPVVTRYGRVSKPPRKFSPEPISRVRTRIPRTSKPGTPISPSEDPIHERYRQAEMDLMGAEIEQEVEDLMDPLGSPQEPPGPSSVRQGRLPRTSTPDRASGLHATPSFHFGAGPGESGPQSSVRFRRQERSERDDSPPAPATRVTRSSARSAATKGAARTEANSEKEHQTTASKSTRVPPSRTSPTSTKTKR